MYEPQRLSDSRPLRAGWWWLAAVFVAYRIVPFVPEEVNSFAASHFLYSYTAGLHKRALLGFLVQLPGAQLTAVRIYALSLLLLLLWAGSLLTFCARVMFASRTQLLLGLALIGGPAVLPHFAYSLGYVDPLLVMYALGIACLISSSLPKFVSLSAAIGLCIIAALTHESFVIAAFPLVAIIQSVRRPGELRLLWPLAAVLMVVPALIQFAGHPQWRLDRYLAAAAARTDIHVNREAFELLYFSPRENFSYLVQHYFSLGTDLRLVTAFIIPIPYFVWLRDLFLAASGSGSDEPEVARLLLACVIAPMALMLVGFDALRWVSFACLNCSIYVLERLRADTSGEVVRSLQRYIQSPRFALLALWSFAIGSLHVVDSNGIGSGVHSLGRGLGLID